MKTLIIKDLARTEQLDRATMAGVRGGFKLGAPSYVVGNVNYAPSTDASLHAAQSLEQLQNVVNATANGSAFLDGIHANNHTSQTGQNNIFA